MLLLGMGLDEFSMSAGEVSRVKSRLREADYEEAKKAAEDIQSKGSVTEVIDSLL